MENNTLETVHTDIITQAVRLTRRAFRYFQADHNPKLFLTIKEEFISRLVEREERVLSRKPSLG